MKLLILNFLPIQVLSSLEVVLSNQICLPCGRGATGDVWTLSVYFPAESVTGKSVIPHLFSSAGFTPSCGAACLLWISLEFLLLSYCLTHVTGVCLSFLLSIKSSPCFSTLSHLLLLFFDCFPHSRSLMFHVSLLVENILNLLILFSLKYLFFVLNVFDVVCLGSFSPPSTGHSRTGALQNSDSQLLPRSSRSCSRYEVNGRKAWLQKLWSLFLLNVHVLTKGGCPRKAEE